MLIFRSSIFPSKQGFIPSIKEISTAFIAISIANSIIPVFINVFIMDGRGDGHGGKEYEAEDDQDPHVVGIDVYTLSITMKFLRICRSDCND